MTSSAQQYLFSFDLLEHFWEPESKTYLLTYLSYFPVIQKNENAKRKETSLKK